MVSIKKKKIKNHIYLYAEQSFRLPNQKIKKLSKLIKKPDDAYSTEIKQYFLLKETEANQEYGQAQYIPDSVLTSERIAQLEAFKIEYKHLLQNLTSNQFKCKEFSIQSWNGGGASLSCPYCSMENSCTQKEPTRAKRVSLHSVTRGGRFLFEDLLTRFTVNFTYESNALEGNSLTLKDVTLILTENIVPKNKELREVYETRNTLDVTEELFAHKIKITIKDILHVQERLVRDTGVSVGFKKFPNFLLMRNVQTTPPEKVQEEMNLLVEWYQQNKGKLHPFLLAVEFHGKFEKIHPFEDGNGRTGRVLLNAILLENGFAPLIIRKTTRQAYFSALEAYDNGFKLKLERFLLEKLKETFDKFFRVYVKYI